MDPAPRFLIDRLPEGWRVHAVTSDEFFASNPELEFGIIFIDGWHEYSQVTRDLVNSLRRIRVGGLILIDDVLPGSADAATAQTALSSQGDLVPPGWAGDVFRLVYLLSLVDPNGDHYCTIDAEGPLQTVVFSSARHLDLASRSDQARALEWDPSWVTTRPAWLRPVPSIDAALRRELGR